MAGAGGRLRPWRDGQGGHRQWARRPGSAGRTASRAPPPALPVPRAPCLPAAPRPAPPPAPLGAELG